MASSLQYLWMNVQVVALENVSFSDTQNPKTVCYHIDCRQQPLAA